MSVLITGVAGFVGFHVAKMLLERGETVVGIDIFNTETSTHSEKQRRIATLQKLGGDFVLHRCDIRDRNELREVFQQSQPERVFHAAALVMDRRSVGEPYEFIETNVIGSLNVIDAVSKIFSVKQLVFASTRSVIGEAKFNDPYTSLNGESIPFPVNPYGASKLGMEGLASSFHATTNSAVTVIRFQPMYGPFCRDDMAIKRLCLTALDNTPFYKFGSGEATRDWLYVEDAARGICSALFSDKKEHRVFNFGTGRPTSLNHLIVTLELIVGKELNIIPVDSVIGDAKHGGVADISKAKELLGFMPEVSLEEGLQRTYAHYVEEKRLRAQVYTTKTIKVGLVGTGIFARKAHAPALVRSSEVDLAAVCSREESRAHGLISQLDLNDTTSTSAYDDYHKFVSSVDFNAIDLVVPTPSMFAMIFYALVQGNNVLSEKPVAQTMVEANLLLKIWEHMNPRPVWLVSENWRLEPAFIAARKIIEKGGVGDVLMITCRCNIARNTDSVYEQCEWRKDDESNNTWVKDIGVHIIAAMRLLSGDELTLLSTTRVQTQESQARDSITAIFSTVSSAQVILTLSYAQLEKNDQLQQTDSFVEQFDVSGTLGRLSVSRQKLTHYNSSGRKSQERVFNEYTVDKAINSFAEAVREEAVREDHPLHPRQALADLRLIEKILSHVSEEMEETYKMSFYQN